MESIEQQNNNMTDISHNNNICEREDEEDIEMNNQISKIFIILMSQFYKNMYKEFEEWCNITNEKEKKNRKGILLKKFKCLKKLKNISPKSKKRVKNCHSLIRDIINYFDEYDSENEAYLNAKEYIQEFYTLSAKKIRGIFKHAQTMKTYICNLNIVEWINFITEDNTLSIAFTKNDLEANEQWFLRFVKDIKPHLPYGVTLRDIILVVSSKKPDGDTFTHCKNMDKAWKLMSKKNNFKILFVCSNVTRINDIYELVKQYQRLKEEFAKKLNIIHDEAHNSKCGVPAYRECIENIIIQPNVLTYMPCTATPDNIYDNNNPLWNQKNIEHTAFDYTKIHNEFMKTKSTDPNYSSCSDYTLISFEELKKNPNWREHDIKAVSKDLFERVTNDPTIKRIKRATKKILIEDYDIPEQDSLNNMIQDALDKDTERRRKLEFCKFMELDKEKRSVNYGLNWLNANNLLSTCLFIENKFNLHIISTPNRKVVTAFLCEEAIQMYYKPIILGIYGSKGDKYHLYDEDHKLGKSVDHIMGGGEFNNKLLNLVTHLKEDDVNINRPFIVIGNYDPTGESITFVNSEYGTVRSNCRLNSTNASEDYQQACRGNYTTIKFREKDRDFTPPPKYLCMEERGLNNVKTIEKINDERIDELESRLENMETSLNITTENHNSRPLGEGSKSIPCRINIDAEANSHEHVKEMREIMSRNKSHEDKERFMQLLKICHEDPDIDVDIVDPTGKLNLETMKINQFRCYKREYFERRIGGENPMSEEDAYKKIGEQWKFSSYTNHHNGKSPWMNDPNDHKVNECDILTCADKFIVKKDGKTIFKNTPNVWWLSYKY